MKYCAQSVAFLIVAETVIPSLGTPVMVSPYSSVPDLETTPSTTNVWWQADDSMRKPNETIGVKWFGVPEGMVEQMAWGLLEEPYLLLTRTEELSQQKTPKILEALYRGGDDPRITNILHQALLAPTNHYREATFRAYVMASPVPMTRLAETVVLDIPRAERRQWYAHSGETAWRPPSWGGLFGSGQKPSREALRFAHFLFMAKQIETDPECLRAIGNPTDPKRE